MRATGVGAELLQVPLGFDSTVSDYISPNNTAILSSVSPSLSGYDYHFSCILIEDIFKPHS